MKYVLGELCTEIQARNHTEGANARVSWEKIVLAYVMSIATHLFWKLLAILARFAHLVV